MNPLLAEPTSEQVALLDVIYHGREQAGWPNYQRAEQTTGEMQRVGKPSDWPIFQYVETVLYQEHGLDATTVIRECQSVPFNAGQGRYGWIGFDKHDAMVLGAEDKVRLDVAGMVCQPRAAVEVEVFVDALAVLVDVDRALTPSPSEVQNVQIGAGELRCRLEPPHGRWRLGVAELDSIAAMLDSEPSTWNWQVQRGEAPGEWTATLRPFIRAYSGIRTPGEYLERVVQRLVPYVVPPAPLHPSSLSLPEAIDYLNAVWRTHAGKPLFQIARAEAAAKLALDCATADELDARLSAFCGILGHLQLPEEEDGDTGRLIALNRHLAQRLPVEAGARAERAVDELRAFFDLRAWRQHPGADERGIRGMKRLEVDLPTGDWQGAWQHLQARAVAALSALREEVDALS